MDELFLQAEQKHPHALLRECLVVNYPPELADVMQDVIIIILTQLSSDPGARAVLNDTLIDPAYQKLGALFQYLEKHGKIKPMDPDPFIYTYISISYYTLYNNYLNSNEDMTLKWEKALNQLINTVEVIE